MTYFPPPPDPAGATVAGASLALAVHTVGARYGLDLGRRGDPIPAIFMPAGAAGGVAAYRDRGSLPRFSPRDPEGSARSRDRFRIGSAIS